MEKKKTYEELVYENGLLRLAVDKVTQGIFITDEDGVIVVLTSPSRKLKALNRKMCCTVKKKKSTGI